MSVCFLWQCLRPSWDQGPVVLDIWAPSPENGTVHGEQTKGMLFRSGWWRRGREVTKTWKLGREKLPRKELVWFSALLWRAPQSWASSPAAGPSSFSVCSECDGSVLHHWPFLKQEGEINMLWEKVKENLKRIPKMTPKKKLSLCQEWDPEKCKIAKCLNWRFSVEGFQSNWGIAGDRWKHNTCSRLLPGVVTGSPAFPLLVALCWGEGRV